MLKKKFFIKFHTSNHNSNYFLPDDGFETGSLEAEIEDEPGAPDEPGAVELDADLNEFSESTGTAKKLILLPVN